MKSFDNDVPVPLEQNDDSSDEIGRCKNKRYPENKEKIWDGSESEFIEDDDALAYEEPQPGIKIDYTLKYDEMLSFLKKFSDYKNKNKKLIINTVLLSVVLISCVISFFIYKSPINIALLAVCAILIAVIWLVPIIYIKSVAKEITYKKSIYIEIYPDSIIVGKEGVETEIPLDGTTSYKEFDNLFLIFPKKGEALILPVRAIEPDFLPDIEAILMAGTVPYTD